jgi:disulfide bond formation protein DsbB
MTPLVSNVSLILSILTVVALVGVASFIIASLFEYVSGKRVNLIDSIAPHALLIAGVTAIIATLGSLFYSEVAGFTPCVLCWYQRIFMYPLSIILVLAYTGKDFFVRRYVITLASVGAIIAGYQNYLIYGGSALTKCTAVPGAESCAKKFIMGLDFVTIPMMALSACLVIILVIIVV